MIFRVLTLFTFGMGVSLFAIGIPDDTGDYISEDELSITTTEPLSSLERVDSSSSSRIREEEEYECKEEYTHDESKFPGGQYSLSELFGKEVETATAAYWTTVEREVNADGSSAPVSLVRGNALDQYHFGKSYSLPLESLLFLQECHNKHVVVIGADFGLTATLAAIKAKDVVYFDMYCRPFANHMQPAIKQFKQMHAIQTSVPVAATDTIKLADHHVLYPFEKAAEKSSYHYTPNIADAIGMVGSLADVDIAFISPNLMARTAPVDMLIFLRKLYSKMHNGSQIFFATDGFGENKQLLELVRQRQLEAEQNKELLLQSGHVACEFTSTFSLNGNVKDEFGAEGDAFKKFKIAFEKGNCLRVTPGAEFHGIGLDLDTDAPRIWFNSFDPERNDYGVNKPNISPVFVEESPDEITYTRWFAKTYYTGRSMALLMKLAGFEVEYLLGIDGSTRRSRTWNPLYKDSDDAWGLYPFDIYGSAKKVKVDSSYASDEESVYEPE